MSTEFAHVEWLDSQGTITEQELARMCRLSLAELEELVDDGLLTPTGGSAPSRVFSASCVQPLREASALRSRFGLDLFVAGLMFRQLERIARLEQQLRSLHAHLPHPAPEREGPASWREPHG